MESALKSFLTSSLSMLVVAAFLLTPALVDGKSRVKRTVKLAEGEALVLSVDGDLSQCKKWLCLVKLRELGKKKDLHQIRVQSDGSWVAYAAEEEDEDKEGDDDDSAGDDDDSAGDDDDSAGDDDDSADDWMEKPVLTRAERRAKGIKKAMGKYTVEAGTGAVWGKESGGLLMDLGKNPSKEDKAAAKAEMAAAIEKNKETPPQMEIPSNLLPEGKFSVAVSGYFGLSYDGVKLGSGSKSGVLKVKR